VLAGELAPYREDDPARIALDGPPCCSRRARR